MGGGDAELNWRLCGERVTLGTRERRGVCVQICAPRAFLKAAKNYGRMYLLAYQKHEWTSRCSVLKVFPDSRGRHGPFRGAAQVSLTNPQSEN